MGCDWFSSGLAYFGYSFSYGVVFSNTKFGSRENMYDVDTWEDVYGGSDSEREDDDDEEENDDKDADQEQQREGEEGKKGNVLEAREEKKGKIKGTAESNNPHKVLASKWKAFVAKHYPGFAEKNIVTYIGCCSMPGGYESNCCTDYCDVVFGYLIDETKIKVDKGEHTLSLPSLPRGLSDAILEFISEFNKDPQSSDEPKSKKSKKSKRKRDMPKVITFLNY